MSRTVRAIIGSLNFLTTEEGGRQRTPPNPAGGHLKITDELFVTCTIVALDESGTALTDLERLQLGVRYHVLIVSLLPQDFDFELTTIEVFEGQRLVAHGSVHAKTEVDLETLFPTLQ